jgi:hypothetical protein
MIRLTSGGRSDVNAMTQATSTHPARNAVPPMGVMAPSHLTPVTLKR